MDGPGKYDDITTSVREATSAKAVLVVVVRGTRGDGASMQGTDNGIALLPELLRRVADDIEARLWPRPS